MGGVCLIPEKNKPIKCSNFPQKFEQSLLTWRAADLAIIHSLVCQACRLRMSRGVTMKNKTMDLTLIPVSEKEFTEQPLVAYKIQVSLSQGKTRRVESYASYREPGFM